MFMFAIYYAVSALVGVIWRSAIASIAMSILFWLICFAVGTAKIGFENTVLNKARLAKLIQAENTLIGVNELGFAQEWDPEKRKWNEVFVSGDQQQLAFVFYMMSTIPRELRPVGPVYDEKNDRMILIMRSIQGKMVFSVGRRDEQWESDVPSTTPPMGVVALLREPDGEILVASSMGLFRIVGDLFEQKQPIKIGNWEVPFLGGSSALRNVGPDPPIILTQPADAALNQDTGELALYSRGRITVLARNDSGEYEVRVERKLEGEERKPARIAFGGSTLLVGRSDGQLLALDAETLKQRNSFQPEGTPTQPRFVEAAPGGRWIAALFHNRQLYLLDTSTDELSLAPFKGQGDISAVAFPNDAEILAADRTTRVSRYALPSYELTDRVAAKLGVLESAHRYAMVPLYTVFPKPGELDKTFDYILSGKKTKGNQEAAEDLEAAQQTVDPWSPVWSSALFTLVILAIACIFIERSEF